MSSRMDRYENLNSKSRVSKNQSLYEDVKKSTLSRVSSNNTVTVIESNGKTIDLDKIRKFINEGSNVDRNRRVTLNIPKEEDEVDTSTEKSKDYDINSVLTKARENREVDYSTERHKRLRDTELDILSKIKMYEEVSNKCDEVEEELNTEEKTLANLIQTVTVHKGELNLLDELIGDPTEEVTSPINEEIEKNSIIDVKEIKEDSKLDKTEELTNLKEKISDIDKSFYTNSMSFSKEDFEGFEELERSVKKSSVLTFIMILLLVIFIVVTLVIISNYVFDLGLF